MPLLGFTTEYSPTSLTTPKALGGLILSYSSSPGKCLERRKRRINMYWTNKQVSELCIKRPEHAFICVTSSELHNTLIGEGGQVLVRWSTQNRLREGSHNLSLARSLPQHPRSAPMSCKKHALQHVLLLLRDPVFFLVLNFFQKWDNCRVCFLKGGGSINKQNQTKTKP